LQKPEGITCWMEYASNTKDLRKQYALESVFTQWSSL